MTRGWKTFKIKDVAEGLFDGPHATPKPSDTGPVFLGINNITDDGHLNLTDIRHIADDDYAAWTKRVVPQSGDIVFTYEATLNRYAIIPDNLKCCLGRRMALVRVDSTKCDARFLHFYFFGTAWRKAVAANIISGSTVDRIPLTTFPDFPVHLPPLPTQRRIASILSAYDDLIENNTKRIKILEDMARVLYREWFVHFRFPGHEKVRMIDSPLGKIPEGWEVVKVSDIVIRTKNKPVYTESEILPSGSIIVVDQSTDECLGFHDGIPTHSATPTEPVGIFGDHTCKMQLLTSPFSTGPNVVTFTALPSVSLMWLFFAMDNLIETREYKRHWSELNAKEVVRPEGKTTFRYADLVAPILALIETHKTRNRILRKTRDLLLPKLISGEIDVDGVLVEGRKKIG